MIDEKGIGKRNGKKVEAKWLLDLIPFRCEAAYYRSLTNSSKFVQRKKRARMVLSNYDEDDRK